MNAKEFIDLQVQTRGEFGGLGLEVSMENGAVTVVSPIEDTPAARAGLQSGDLITAVDRKQLQGFTLQEAVEKMRGPAHSPITLTIVRKGVDAPFEVTMVRDVIHIKPVKYRAENDVGYIQITSFSEQTTEELEAAVKHLKKEIGPNLKGYLIDLRNNPGGLLDQAIAVFDNFLAEGAIVITMGRNLDETQRAICRGHHRARDARSADQWRPGLGLGYRRRRAATSPQEHRRNAVLRQGLRPDYYPARIEWCAPTNHRSLFHTVGALDPGPKVLSPTRWSKKIFRRN